MVTKKTQSEVKTHRSLIWQTDNFSKLKSFLETLLLSGTDNMSCNLLLAINSTKVQQLCLTINIPHHNY